jgi:hypothetical protein
MRRLVIKAVLLAPAPAFADPTPGPAAAQLCKGFDETHEGVWKEAGGEGFTASP